MIIFSRHALLKLEQRGISKIAARETLKFPDHNTASYLGRMVAYKKFDKLYLKVVYKIESKDIIVITQYWVEKPKFIK